MAISAAKAKALCTASELALVTGSGKQQVKLLSAPQLRLKVQQARKLRDKWRDQAAKQQRTAQAKAGSRQPAGNARSAEKAELFAEVLGRYEAEMAKPKADRSDAVRARKAAPLKSKKASHSTERAEVRKALRQKRRKLAAAGIPSAPPTKKGAPASAAEAVANELPAVTKKAAPRKKRKASAPGNPSSAFASAPTPGTGLQVSKRYQAKANARAKQSRLQAAGIKRIQTNASARNKRRQASRDAR